MRLFISFLLGCVLFCSLNPAVWAEDEAELGSNARSAIVLDATSGAILYEKNSHEALPPASITKIMTMLLVMEALDNGKIKLQDRVPTSEKAASMGGSQIYLEPGEQMTVDDLLKGVAIGSANDATVALAEFLARSEERFVQKMNERAKQLGMKQTHFANTNGLSAEGHHSSAYDIALMSKALLEYPRITQYTRRYEDYLRKGSKKPFWLVNTNKLVRFYPGADGLKTGFTQEAKYGLAATAKRGSMRVIAVVLGEPDVKMRNAEVTQLLDYAFQSYTNQMLFQKGELIGKLQVGKGEPDRIPIYAERDIAIVLKKGEAKQPIQYQVHWVKQKAPIAKGDVVGQLQLLQAGKVINSIPLHASEQVEKAGFWQMLKKSMGEGLFLSGS